MAPAPGGRKRQVNGRSGGVIADGESLPGGAVVSSLSFAVMLELLLSESPDKGRSSSFSLACAVCDRTGRSRQSQLSTKRPAAQSLDERTEARRDARSLLEVSK